MPERQIVDEDAAVARILELADSLAPLGQRTVTVARELTKQFEQIGNAVPIPLGAALGRMLAAKLG